MTASARLRIDRGRAAALGREAVSIGERGDYRAPSGRVVDLRQDIAAAVAGTRSYAPDAAVPLPKPGPHATRFTVVNDTTLAAARALIERGRNPVALNFASATSPGGGFLAGARAQEEYLARSSALFTCIAASPMYPFHQALDDPLHTDFAIHSPSVPVFRDDAGELLEQPWRVAILTCAAPNATSLEPERIAEIAPAMRSRIRRVLALGAHLGHDAIVLGAWGCGAFGNDGHLVARLFSVAFEDMFASVYAEVVFAVTDWSPERRFIGPFAEAFGQPVDE